MIVDSTDTLLSLFKYKCFLLHSRTFPASTVPTIGVGQMTSMPTFAPRDSGPLPTMLFSNMNMTPRASSQSTVPPRSNLGGQERPGPWHYPPPPRTLHIGSFLKPGECEQPL